MIKAFLYDFIIHLKNKMVKCEMEFASNFCDLTKLNLKKHFIDYYFDHSLYAFNYN
jgi:hypothetical protein